MSEPLIRHHGGCHCGAVRFQIRTPSRVEVHRCNCSICSMCGFAHLIIPASHFHLLSGADDLECYRFNTGTARHLFCRHCGIKSYYVPRSNPDGYSVNFNCLESPDFQHVQCVEIDGRNWEQSAAGLADLSKEP